MSAPLIECQNLSVFRGEIRALDRVSLSIAAGEHVAILGPNGCGKSTLIKTLTRELYPAVEDPPCTLRILGRDRWTVTDLRALLGIVTQDLVTECTKGMSSDFAEYPRRVTGAIPCSPAFSSIGVWAHHETTRHRYARRTRSSIGSRPGRTWPAPAAARASSGEARRLVIGRASSTTRPRSSSTRSPTARPARRAPAQGNDRAIAQAGTAVVIVTHHLPEIILEVGRVLLMKRGRLVGDGPKADLLSSRALSEVFEMPIDVGQRDGYFHAW